MNKESNLFDFRSELESLSEIEVLENEEMWSIRIIDEVSSKESISGVIIQLTHQDDSAKG
jgi:hypothetical protein